MSRTSRTSRICAAVVLGILVLVAVALAGPPSVPAAPGLSALGVSMDLKAPVAIGSIDPDVVYFVRLNEGESLDSALARAEVIATNESSGGRLFVLGAIPGTYVAVAAAYRKARSSQPMPLASGSPSRNVTVSVGFDPFQGEEVFRTYFAREDIESTTVVLGPDSFRYAGHLVVKQSLGIADGDEPQRRFQQVLEGKAAKQSGFMRAMTGTHSYRGSLRELQRDQATEAKFLEKAAKRLRKTDWAALLDKRRAALQGAPPAGP